MIMSVINVSEDDSVQPEHNDEAHQEQGILDLDDDTRTVDSFVTLNLQARYSGIDNTVITLGIDNVFDEDPPFAIGDGDADLYGYVSGQHSPRGQFIYSKVTYRF